MKFLGVVTLPSIYHGCSTRKTFWEEKFTGKKYLFRYMNMKIVVVAKLVNTTLDILVFPNFATTTIFHVHIPKQIFLTCELSLPECLPSGSTMINRRWCYNY